MKLTTAILIATLAAGTSFAQTINQRKTNQQERIAQGVRSGELTPHEAARTERQEASINRQESRMRARDHGHLTRVDRAELQHRQNVESRRIFRQKHDAQVRARRD